MLRNYLVTALRNLARHRLYGFINIAGLAVGLACAILIVLFLRDELSYERWIAGSQDIYRVEVTLTYPGTAAERAATAPFPLAAAMQSGIREIQGFARRVPEETTVKAGNRQFSETIEFVDPDFFTLLRMPLVRGDAARVFANPESIVLTENMARKYFGSSDPVGKVLTVEGKYPLSVAGVLRNLPHNTQFTGEFFVSNKSNADVFPDKSVWFDFEPFAYVRIPPGADIPTIVEKAQGIIRRNANPAAAGVQHERGDQIIQTRLVRLTDVHLAGDEDGDHNSGSWSTVYGFAAIAAMILAIACFNFTNLATARAMRRAREMSLRKVVGANRVQLVVQFLGESVLTALLALVLALAVVEILLPAYDSFLNRPIAFSWLRDWPLGLAFAIVAVVAGLLAGLYPALVLSGFRPGAMLRGSGAETGGSGVLRTGLVVLQFAISIGLGIAAIVIFVQIDYARRIDLGFDHDNVVVLQGADDMEEATRESLMHRLAASPDIAGVAQSSAAPFGGIWQGTDVTTRGDRSDLEMRIMTVSPDFSGVYGIKLLAGRLLSADRGNDISNLTRHDSDAIAAGTNVLANVAAARELGFTPDQAVGKIVRVGHLHTPARIVGVLGNTSFYGARDRGDPTIYVDRPYSIYVISVRAKGGRIPEAIAAIDNAWGTFAPTVAIRRHFLDDSFDKLFASDELQGDMFGIFVAIAIFIACLGLFGLAALVAERRTKEIGVRKVFGARSVDVVRLLLWQFSVRVLVANMIAWPVAWYYLHNWLESYAYRITLSPVYFLAAGGAALLIAWLTVIGHSLAVARANPVHALRYE